MIISPTLGASLTPYIIKQSSILQNKDLPPRDFLLSFSSHDGHSTYRPSRLPPIWMRAANFSLRGHWLLGAKVPRFKYRHFREYCATPLRKRPSAVLSSLLILRGCRAPSNASPSPGRWGAGANQARNWSIFQNLRRLKMTYVGPQSMNMNGLAP